MTIKDMQILLLPLLTLCLGLLPAAATDPVDQQDSQTKFEQALKWLNKGDISIRGRLSEEAKGGMSGNVMIIGGGMGGEKFKGSFFAQLDSQADLWVVSKDEFPGFSMKLGSSRVFQTTFDRSPLDLSSMANELEALLSVKRLKKYGSKVEWRAQQTSELGDWVLEGELPKKFIPSSGGMMGFGPKVKSVTLSISINADGSVSELEMRVLQGDPFANLHGQMENGGSIGIDRAGIPEGAEILGGEIPEGAEILGGEIPEGGGLIGGSPFGDMDADDMPDGATTVYKLKLSKKKAEDRIVAFQKFCNNLSVEEDFYSDVRPAPPLDDGSVADGSRVVGCRRKPSS
jgi:hypothetical protein